MLSALIPEWVGLALTPLAIAGTVILLTTDRPILNTVAFAIPFGIVYSALSALVLAIGATVETGSGDSVARYVASLIVGILFLCVGLAVLIRPVKRRSGPPRWSTALSSATPGKIAVTSTALALVNPNVAILLSGLIIVVTSVLALPAQIGWAVTLVAATLVPFLIPTLVYLIWRQQSTEWLAQTLAWIERHDRVLTISLLLLFGVIFTLRGLAGML